MGLLVSEGHVHAGRYPLVRVWSEAAITRRRIGTKIAKETQAMYYAMTAVLGGKATEMNKSLERLRRGE